MLFPNLCYQHVVSYTASCIKYFLLNYFKQLSATNWGKKYLGLLVVEAKILLRQRGARDLGGLINNNNLGKER